jgi:ketosteroid isomerase-like protein
MRIRMSSCGLFAIATTLVASPTRGSAQTQDQRTALLAAERAGAEMSRDSGLTRAVLQTIRPDAVLLWPGAPVLIGQDQIRKHFDRARIRDSVQVSWQPLAAEISRDSSVGVTWGVAAAAAAQGAGAPQLGRYIASWRREGTHWKIAALAFMGMGGIALDSASVSPPLTREPVSSSGAAGPFVAADLAFAKLAGDSGAAVAFTRWASPDAVIFANRGMLTRGPAEIGRAVDGPAKWQWHPVAADAARSGDLGWTVGEAIISAAGEQPNYSKYLTVWTRQSDGSVRFLTDGGNQRPAAPWSRAQSQTRK